MITIKKVDYENLSIIYKNNLISSITSLLCEESSENINHCINWIKQWFENEISGDKHTFIALDNDNLVGIVRLWSTPYLGNKWYIEGLEVSSSQRRKGIASKLITTAINYSKENNIPNLWSNISISNAASIKLHESLGFKLASKGSCNTYGSYRPNNNCYYIDLTSCSQNLSHIRPYEEHDFEKVIEIYKELEWPTFYNRLDDSKNAFTNSSFAFVYEIDNEIVGFIRALTDYHISTFIPEVLIKSHFRGKGIGTALLDMCHKLYPTCRIELLTDDSADFYRKIGFNQEFIGMRKSFKI